MKNLFVVALLLASAQSIRLHMLDEDNDRDESTAVELPKLVD